MKLRKCKTYFPCNKETNAEKVKGFLCNSNINTLNININIHQMNKKDEENKYITDNDHYFTNGNSFHETPIPKNTKYKI